MPSLTLSQVGRTRRPSPSTLCETCPAALWTASEIDLQCYCRIMLHQLEPDGTVSANRLRRPADRPGESAAQRVGGPAPGALHAYHQALDAHASFGDPFERLPSMRAPARRTHTGMSPPGSDYGRRGDLFLDRFDTMDVSLDFDAAEPIVLRQPERPVEMPPYRSRRSRAGDDVLPPTRNAG